MYARIKLFIISLKIFENPGFRSVSKPRKPVFIFRTGLTTTKLIFFLPDFLFKFHFSVQGMVSALDEAVKNVTQSFKDHGLWEDTILVFSTGKVHLVDAYDIC